MSVSGILADPHPVLKGPVTVLSRHPGWRVERPFRGRQLPLSICLYKKLLQGTPPFSLPGAPPRGNKNFPRRRTPQLPPAWPRAGSIVVVNRSLPIRRPSRMTASIVIDKNPFRCLCIDLSVGYWRSPSIAGPVACDLIGALFCNLSVLSCNVRW